MPCGMSLQLGWIPVRKSVKLDANVDTNDAIEIDVRLLPILPEAALDEVVREELERRGWSRQPDGAMTKTFGEATATLPASSSTITLTIEARTSVAVEATESGAAPEDDASAQQAIEDKARRTAGRKLDDAAARARRLLERRNADELLRVEPDLRKDVNEVVNATTKRALQRRAASLGEIESMNEADGADGYELTITVRT